MDISKLPPVHPGESLLQELIERDWSPSQLANLIGLDLESTQNLLRADETVTPELAERISAATGVSASFWLGSQADYDRKMNPPVLPATVDAIS